MNPGEVNLTLLRRTLVISGLLVFSLLVTSCKKSPFPGYELIDGGVYYKLLVFGEDRRTAKPGDYVNVDIAYYTLNDSLFFYGRRTLQLTEPEFPGSIDYCFMAMAEFDSASFIISAQGLFEKTLNTELPPFLQPGDFMKVNIKMHLIRTEEQYIREKEEFLAWIRDFGEYEQTVLRNFIEHKEIKAKPTPSGMYFLPIKKGNSTKKVNRGDIVTVHYEGRFLNGKFFDSTIKRNQPFDFVYGTEWQVIKGLEEAISYMTEGEKAIVIMPSELAWGRQGSSTGIIPPFTSVIYEVELLKIESRAGRR